MAMRRHEQAWYEAVGEVVDAVRYTEYGLGRENWRGLEAIATILKGRERRMKQRAVQLGTFGTQVAERINALLDANPAWRFVSVTNIQVHRIGGPDIHVIVMFEAPEEAPAFRE